ncbi:MAG: O-antigen ligase family protein [Bacteroidales bacterium]|nr:O-antigen ligase family protein [Bacteroidales bacterium]
MIKLINILPQSNKRNKLLHITTLVLLMALFAFPLFPMHLTNVIFISFSILTLVAWFINPVPVRKSIWKNLVFILPFLPYLFEFLLNSFDPLARFEFEKKLFFFTSFFVFPIFMNLTGFKNYKLLLLVFSLSVTALCLYAFAGLMVHGIPFSASAYENGSFILRHHFEKLSGLHSTYYSVFALLSAYFLFKRSFSEKKPVKIGLIVLASILLLSALYIAVRIAFITTAVFIFFLILEQKTNLRQKLFYGITALIIFLSVSFLFPSLKSRLGEFGSMSFNNMNHNNTISQRTAIMSCSWHVFSNNLIMGTGSKHFQQKLNNCYSSKDWPEGANLNFNPHNQYLSIGINYGIFGLLLFISCLFIIGRKLIKFPEGKYFCIAILLFFLTESLLERSMGVYLFGLIAVLMFNIKDSTNENQIT